MRKLAFLLIFGLAMHSGISKAQKQVPVYVESLTMVYMDELDSYFYQSAVNFINFNDKIASEEITKAAVFIGLEADKIKEPANKKLVDVKNELSALSRDLILGKVENIQRLKRTFARTHYTLAKYYITKSKSLVSSGELNKSLPYLEAASNYLVHGVKWVGHEVSKETRLVRKSVDNLVLAVNTRDEINKNELDRVLKFIDKEIIKFGNKLGEQKKAYDAYIIDIIQE